MSHGPAPKLSVLGWLLRVIVLVAVFACMWLGARWSPTEGGGAASLAALGFLLLAGDLTGQIVGLIKLPHLTGYLMAGLVAGPHVLHLVDHGTVENLQIVNGLALALIAFEAGAELSIEMLKKGLGTLIWGCLTQVLILFPVMAAVFFAARPLMPFLDGQPALAVLGLSLLWGVVAVVKSPSAALGLLSETGASGPLARYAVAMVVLLDILILVLVALMLVVARTLIEPGATFSFSELAAVGHEILASIAVGTTIGLVVALYLRFVGKGLILFLLALAFGATELAKYFGYDALLIFAVAGFVVQNLSAQGPRLLGSIAQTGRVVYVVFFALAGAHLDLPTVRALWPVALLFAGARGIATFSATRLSSKLASDPEVIRKWGWSPLISQAGVAIGIASIAAAAFPQIGAGFRSLAIAVVGINETFGPVLFKFALDRSGESKKPH
jgi:Kef-type K+ transport system membrane component KefB